MSRILVLLVSVATGLCAANLTTKVDGKSEGLRYKSLIGRIDRQEFVETALGVLSPKEVVFGAVVAYPTAQDRLLAGPRDLENDSYEGWRASLVSFRVGPGNCPEVQEALKIGENILYRSVNRQCHAQKVLLQGKRDPLQRLISGTQVEILELGAGRGPSIAMHARAKADSVTETLGKAIVAEMKRLSGALDVFVSLRSDVWFLDDAGFPRFFGFGERPLYVPTKEEFAGGNGLDCSTFDPWPINCFVTSGQPKAVK